MGKGLARFFNSSAADMARRPQQSVSNTRQQYDAVSKAVIQQNPKDWVEFSLGIPEIEVVEVLETDYSRDDNGDGHARIIGYPTFSAERY